MTDQEADAFWKAEFQKAHDEVSLDEYDSLLSEVFNRSEDELDIDFCIDDRLADLLDQFSPETWEYKGCKDLRHKIRSAKRTISTW